MKNNRNKNAGFSLVELVVIIAIVSILTAGTSIGVSLAFSRDAARCANILNDTLYSVRMDSMSKPGKYTMEVKNAGSTNTQYVAEIKCDDILIETVYLEGDAAANKVNIITAKLKSGGSEVQLMSSEADSLKIEFDKSKGCVETGTGTDIPGDGIIEFHIIPRSSNRTSDVSLITATGKHTVGTY